MSRGGDRWDRDRLVYERDDRERDAYYEDDRYYMRGGRGDGRGPDRGDRRASRGYEDDIYIRDRKVYDDEPRYAPQRERGPEVEYDRRVVIDKERDREYYRSPSPRRPAFLRRQSSLDTFDRRPTRRFYEYDREELPPPARREDIYREDYRVPPYKEIPLPKTRGLPPPRRYADRGFYEEIDIAETDRYGADQEYRPYPERFKEREVVRERRRRSTSRDSHTTKRTSRTSRTHRSESRSSTTRTSRSSSSSSSSGGTTVRSEYPKKGKTRIPGRLVSKRALIDLGYPFIEEGTTIIVQKALGQDNIDELLKKSEDYKKSELEIMAARSSAGEVFEERREEVWGPPTPGTRPPSAPQVITIPPPPPPAPVFINGPPPGQAEIIQESETIIKEGSDRGSSNSSHTHHHHHEHSGAIPIGPLALAERSRSRSRSGREIRHEIRALERELAHRPRGEVAEREFVKAERLPDGQLVVYEEEVDKVVSHPKPPRIEKDKKGPPPKLVRAMLATLS